jgi:hypothetical protein
VYSKADKLDGSPKPVLPVRRFINLSSVIVVALALAAALCMSDRARAAGGAYAVEDAEVDDPGACKVESWLSAASNQDRIGSARAGCVFDFGRPVEISPLFQRARSNGVWGSELTLEIKTNFLPTGVGKLGLALQGGPIFDLTTEQVAGGFAVVPATYEFSEQFKINLMVGWSYDREPRWHWLTWGAAFEWKFAEGTPLTLIGEVFGQTGHRDPAQPKLHEPRAQIGIRYTPVETVDFDVIYGRNITGENANWITVGLNVRFNAFGEKAAEPTTRRLVRK